ncbi:DNA-directed RNA polymerase subunit beta', partial [Rhizobium sp. KAs_5_22]
GARSKLSFIESGYLGVCLVDVHKEIVVVNEDCKANKGFEIESVIDTKHNNIIVPLKDRIVGRYSFNDIKDAKGNVVIAKDTLIESNEAEAIIAAGITKVTIRSVLTCDNQKGVCQRCYGRNLATASLVK